MIWILLYGSYDIDSMTWTYDMDPKLWILYYGCDVSSTPPRDFRLVLPGVLQGYQKTKSDIGEVNPCPNLSPGRIEISQTKHGYELLLSRNSYASFLYE